jgi:DNA polymerase-3 subunit delta'
MKFSDILSHESAKQRLRAMIDDNRIPHALLLEGPAGIGKFALARAAAQYIHCENRTNGDSCGVCPSCLQHQSFNHIDTSFVFPIAKKKSSSSTICDDYTSEWREFLTENPYMDFQKWTTLLGAPNTQPQIYVDESEALIHKMSFTSHNARYKVALVWLPERLHPSAANKLLKLIEEPHSDTIFIFVSNEPQEILPTIYSRTQRITLKRLPDNIVASELTSKYSIEPENAMALAHISNGSMITAINNISTDDRNRQFLSMFQQLMRHAYQRKVKELKMWSEDVAKLGREQELQFVEYISRLIRENFIYNLGNPQLNYLNREEAQFSANFARFVNERNVLKIIDELDKVALDIAGNGSPKIVFFDFAVRMILFLKA